MPLNPETHPFVTHPNRTLISLSIPLLLGLIAEPLTGLVDTAFVQSLGVIPLAALGIGTTVLSLGFWVFNFLGISTHTGVAQALGRQDRAEAAQVLGLALIVAFSIGCIVILLGWFLVPVGVRAAGAQPEVMESAILYTRVRLFGAPAVIMLMVAFGALRGVQKMVVPMVISLGINGLNILLDWLLIFGIGIFPEWGIAGAALASALAQWIGVLWAIGAAVRRLGRPDQINWSQLGPLFRVGGDLFLRTGLLIIFMFLSTRVANRMGTSSGAAHQVIRQLWTFSAFVMEAFAETTQSLVGFFFGAGDVRQIRRVARYGIWWGIGAGTVMGVTLWLAEGVVAALLVPAGALAPFLLAWGPAVLSQPINSLAFLTDGIHWGTGDYPYMRNGMLVATLCGGAVLFWIERSGSENLRHVWLAAVVWIFMRALVGFIRIWPGVGQHAVWRQKDKG